MGAGFEMNEQVICSASPLPKQRIFKDKKKPSRRMAFS
jgi:hypothetical protein